MIFRFLVFALIVYMVFYLIRNIFIRPFKQGYANGDPRRKAQANSFERKKKEGEVSISFDPRKDRRNGDQVGEYVDYEEVKDKD